MKQIDFSSSQVEEGVKLLNGAKVKFPDQPINIQLFFGYHGSAHHISPDFEPALDQADVFALENIGRTPAQTELRQRIIEGDELALEEMDKKFVTDFTQYGFWSRLHGMLFNSNVVIHYPDAPEGHVLAKKHFEQTHIMAGVVYAIRAGLATTETLPAPVQAQLLKLFEVYAKRERYMLEHFFPKDLPKTDEINVVGFFGIIHKNIATVLARWAAKTGRDDIQITADYKQLVEHQAYDDYLHRHPVSPEDMMRFLLAEET